MTNPIPRRAIDLLQPALTGLVLLVVGYGANGMGDLKANVFALNVKMMELETTIKIGMGDRFTGQQGEAMKERLDLCEKEMGKHGVRLSKLEQFCAELRGSHNNGGIPR